MCTLGCLKLLEDREKLRTNHSEPVFLQTAATSSSSILPQTFHTFASLPISSFSSNPTQKKNCVKKKRVFKPSLKVTCLICLLLQSITLYVYLSICRYTGSRAHSSFLALKHLGKHVGHSVDTPFHSQSLLFPFHELAVTYLVVEEVLQSFD